jgi:hypothetical protein
MQLTVPGEHATHAPSAHSGVLPLHGESSTHWPLALQTSGV